MEYTGTLLFVSLDRYFVNKIANKILEFKPGKVTFFDGTYGEFQEWKEKNNEQEKIGSLSNENNKKENETVFQEKSSKNQYLLNKENNKRKNKMNKIEKEIEEKEEEIKSIENEMKKEENATDYVKLAELQDKIQEINKDIEKKMEEWEELNNLLESNYS